MSRFYSIRTHTESTLTWGQAESRPIATIMKLDNKSINPNPERRLVTGRCQYPEGNYIYIKAIEEWEYDMLDAFDVPHADDALINGIIKIFHSM